MRNPIRLLSIAALLLVPRLAAADIQVLKTDDSELRIGARTQLLGLGQNVDDQVTDHNRVYLFMKEGRFRAQGRYKDLRMNLEMGLGGEDSIVTPTNVSLGLLDLSLDIPIGILGSNTYLRVGQFKVPYGREDLTYEGSSQFMERSVQDLGFKVGRDVGLALTARPGPLTLIGGVFTGGGRDVPGSHYLPERLGIPEVVLRAGIGDVDAPGMEYELSNDLNPTATRSAFFVNGLYTKDSTIGHSSILNVKLADKSLLQMAGYNPFIGQKALDAGSFWQMGADAVVRSPLAAGSISAEAELNWAGYSNKYGVAHVAGGRAQVGYLFHPFEVAARYAVLFPDKAFNIGTDPLHEITPSVAWYIKGQNLKVVADMPIQMNTVVFQEKGVGSYLMTEMPDEISVLASKTNSAVRQTVVEARLMLQAAF